MKLRILLAIAAALTLAACGKPAPTTEPSGDASSAATPAEAAPASAAPANAAPAAGGALTEAYLIGKWADGADGCKLSQEFLPGGKVDGLFDSWKINGDVLIVGTMGETQNVNVKVIDQKTMETQIAGGTMHTLTRC